MLTRSIDNRFTSFLKDFFSIMESTKPFLIFSHELMDPDAIGSIAGLIDFIQQTCNESREIMVYPSKLSKKSNDLLNIFDFSFDFSRGTIDVENCIPVMVDMNSFSQLDGFASPSMDALQKAAVIIDHHFSEPEPPARLKWIDPTARSNCEIVFSLFEASKRFPRFPAATLMACGLMFDTGFLKHATNDSIHVLNQLIGLGVDINNIRRVLFDKMDISERIARLKAATRCEFKKLDEVVVACSNVSTFEASACRGLISLGADIAIVYADNKQQVRISCRQTEEIYQKKGVNLSVVMQAISGIIGGTGGGHAMAAAAGGVRSGKEAVDEAIKIIINLLTQTSQINKK